MEVDGILGILLLVAPIASSKNSPTQSESADVDKFADAYSSTAIKLRQYQKLTLVGVVLLISPCKV